MTDRQQLEQAIAAQESLRGVVSDGIVDTSIATLRDRLATLDQAAPAGQQRKQVTVLFADVSGFTKASERMDAEDLADTVNRLWERLDATIAEFNGLVDKHIGDAVMGLWGTDEAREDDPEQAIRAALAMQAAIDELATAAGDDALALRIRIGINTGPVVLGEIGSGGEYTAMGNTVNVAARVEGAAPVGGILISHDSYRHVRGLFTVQAQPPLKVKGQSEPLRTYIVTGVRPRAFRLQTRGVEGVETRMVGRDTEMQQLRDSVSRLVAGGRLELVEIVGDAGIGKSRLLYEFEDWLRLQPEELRLFQGRADQQHQGVPFALARDLLFFRFEIADNDPLEVVLTKLEAGVSDFLGEEARAQAHLVGHLVGLDLSASEAIGGILDDAQQLHARALQAFTLLFTAAAQQMPTVVLLEDIHWADQGSLQLILHLVETCAPESILIVALARPSLWERVPEWDRAIAGRVRIDLTPLSTEDSGRLADEVLQRVPAVPDLIRDKIVENAAGNPFYVEELIKMMIEDGVITTGEVWHLEADRLTDLQVPATLTGVLQARLDRLPHRELDVLQRASVVGRIFWDAAIPPPAENESTADHMTDLSTSLAALKTKELIRTHNTPDFDDTHEFIFKHAILHDVTYEGVLKSLRPGYHASVAQWLAARPEVSAHPVMIADQFEKAGRPADAAEWYAAAARQAQALYANDDAISYYRRALAPETLEPAIQIELNRGLAETLMLQARFDEAVATIESMLGQAQAVGDIAGQARALHVMSTANTRLGRSREALQTAEEAEHLLAETHGSFPAELVAVMTRVGWAHLALGHIESARSQATKAAESAKQISDPKSLRGVHNLLGAIGAATAQYGEAADFFERSLMVNRDLGDRIGEGRALLNLGEIARLQGDFERAESMSRQALIIQHELGDRDQGALTMSNLGAAHVGTGDFEQAIVQLKEAGAEFLPAGAAEHISETCRLLAEAYLGSGETTAALGEAVVALAHAEADENPDHLGHAWRVLGNVAAKLDDPIEVEWEGQPKKCDAATCFRMSVAIFTEARMENARALTLWDWAAVEIAQGDAEHGEGMWQEAREVFSSLGLSLFLTRMDAARAELDA